MVHSHVQIRNGRFIVTMTMIAIILAGLIWREEHMSGSNAAAPGLGNPEVRVIPPPYTPAVDQKLKESHGFQTLISYTDAGFEPASTTIKAHQTIRFANNSLGSMWVGQITPDNTPDHPNTLSCDVEFNTCSAIQPLDFWEHTFDTPGTFEYIDNERPQHHGVIHVI